MIPSTAEQLAQILAHLELVAASDLELAVREIGGPQRPATELGTLLVRRELLTGYQLERLQHHERDGFYYGRAKILYQIGAGSFARVYRAVHRDNGGCLAVKVLRKRYGTDPEKQKSFQHEGEMGRLLRHPHIVAIEDVGREHDTSYITMEFVEGQTLRELVRIRKSLDVGKSLELLLQMASALDYAHRRGVTHRDLKASNVLVSSAGQAKIVDFGLAGVDDSGDKALGRIMQPRTVDYAALEKMAGMRDDSVRSDIYFLGTIAYLMLSGAPALQETRDRAMRADPRRFHEIEPLGTRDSHVPRDVVELVGRMMHLDPLERLQSMADVCRGVEHAIAVHAEGSGEAPRAVLATDSGPVKGSLMVVEVSPSAQQTFRKFFGRLGYRVLITENPQRALTRFAATPQPADALVISTHALGYSGVDAFNQLTTDPTYAAVPGVLVAGETQANVAGHVRLDRIRRFVQLPIHTEEMSRLLEELIPARA